MSRGRGARPDWLTRELIPFESRFAEVDGHLIHYVDEGQGPTLFMGGPIGLGLAGRRPADVRALVILNTWSWPVADDPHFVRFSRLMGGAIGGFAIRNFNAFVNVLIPLGTPRRKLPADMMRAYRRARTSPRAESVALPGAGHYVQEESPAEIAAAIRTWWPEHVEARA